jgi:hypothetical protein
VNSRPYSHTSPRFVAGAADDDLERIDDQHELVAAFRQAMQENDSHQRSALKSLARSTGRKKAALYRSLVEAGELD